MTDRFVVVGDDFVLPDEIMTLLRAEFAAAGATAVPNTLIAVYGASTARPTVPNIRAFFIADTFPANGVAGDVFANGPII